MEDRHLKFHELRDNPHQDSGDRIGKMFNGTVRRTMQDRRCPEDSGHSIALDVMLSPQRFVRGTNSIRVFEIISGTELAELRLR